jgi:hypothetical protein
MIRLYAGAGVRQGPENFIEAQIRKSRALVKRPAREISTSRSEGQFVVVEEFV